MKYLAILKDSLREALDNKVMYVTVGLSLLVTLVLLSVGFDPLPPEDVMERALTGNLLSIEDITHGPRKRRGGDERGGDAVTIGRFAVARVERIGSAAPVPESGYRVTIALPFATQADADKVRDKLDPEINRLRGRLTAAERFQLFKIKSVLPGTAVPAGERFAKFHPVWLEVTTEPTLDSRLVWPYAYSLFWGGVPLGKGLPLCLALFLTVNLVLWIGSLATLLTAVIITAFFIPNMLRKGTVDLLLVRPIARWALLVYKYIGGLTFVFINTAVAVVGIWLAMGVRSGVWANSFLLLILVYTFFFAILYAVSALFAVLTRSSVVAILVTCGVWFLLSIVGILYEVGEGHRTTEERDHMPLEGRTSENAFFRVVRVVHFVLPRTRDLDHLGSEAVMQDFIPAKSPDVAFLLGQRPAITWGESTLASLAFITVLLSLACWRFSTKDY
jgi:ABC-type transport system involved in multi-copper enzyme maturation permease subunit